jgi:hypothetical protein
MASDGSRNAAHGTTCQRSNCLEDIITGICGACNARGSKVAALNARF